MRTMEMKTASICTIGDEILIGQIVDTNSFKISRALGTVGVKVTRMLSIGDTHEEILGGLSEELRKNDVVIVTGGLGPTGDDITKAALAELTGSRGYVTDKEQERIIRDILHARGLDILEANRAQAFVPDNCEVIHNRVGTAPIMVFRIPEERFGHKATLYAMPGVPFEMEAALPEVVADIKGHNAGNGNICHRNIMTYGLAESAIAERIWEWEKALPEDMHLAYLPDTLTGVKLRLSIYECSQEEGQRRMDEAVGGLKEILGDIIYSFEEDSLEHALGAVLKRIGSTVSAAESCTGGEISHLITTVPGSSGYYLGSVTSYAVSVKENILGVPAETIRKYGVVSAEVAAAMAEGVRKLTGSDYSVSTTGLAGPGGDGENPEGTVWVGVATPWGTETARFLYHGDRKRNIERFAASALHFLLGVIKKESGL